MSIFHPLSAIIATPKQTARTRAILRKYGSWSAARNAGALVSTHPALHALPAAPTVGSGEKADLRGAIYSATHDVLPLATDEASTQDRALMQVEIADLTEALSEIAKKWPDSAAAKTARAAIRRARTGESQ